MNILITAATKMELPVLPETTHQISTLITGVGVPASMYSLTLALQKKSYNLIIQTGIAGSFNLAKFPLGTVVQVSKDCFADLGATQHGTFSSLIDLGFLDAQEKPFTNGWLEQKNLFNKFTNVPTATGITVNHISDDERYNQTRQQKYDADVETMEGAALHYVCLQQKKSFLPLRAISNKVGERDKSKWVIKEALQALQIEMNYLLQKIV